MRDNKNEYRHILKATSIFGGVQFFNILISIAKSKIVAILIGTTGLGILGILSSTVNLILGVSRMGLDFSAVKEIAASKTNEDKSKLSLKVAITKRLTWLTGLLGAIIILIISPLLSKIALGNTDFTIYFVIVSVAVLFNQMTIGNMAIIQAFSELKKLAKSTVLASFFALIFATIIYYFFGQSGIPWVIAITATTSYFFSKYYVSLISIDKTLLSIRNTIIEGRSMIKLGLVLSLGTLAALLNGYLVQIFITNKGGLEQVGLYNAGFILINSYVLLFFNALSKDFFPRLSEVVSENGSVKQIVNKQAMVTVLLLTPIIVIFLVFNSFIVRLLYTEEFLPIVGMISFGIVGSIFKAISWVMGFIIIAKADTRLYIKIEIVSNLVLFVMTVIGYILNGITGIGISYLIYYILYAILIRFVVSFQYKFSFDEGLKKIMIVSVFLCFTTLYLIYLDTTVIKLVLLITIVLFSLVYTIYMLNRFISFKELLKKKHR